MKISLDKYEEIKQMVDNIDGSEESLNVFIEKFKRLTGVNSIMLADDDVFEIEELDFASIEDLATYFTVQDIIDTENYSSLLKIAESTDSREEFCEKATNLTNIPVKQYGVVVRLNNIDFLNKRSLIEYLNAFNIFNTLSELADDYNVAEDGRGISLDGVAYVHDSRQSMIDNPQEEFPIEGYLFDGEVKWSRVNKDAFKKFKTDKGVTYVLDIGSGNSIKNLYLKKPKEFGVIEKPYPIAILPKNKYVYMYKS